MAPAPGGRPVAAIVDIDGTLVDSNHQHVISWYRALRRFGVVCELRRLHKLVGMGGDQLVQAAAGEEVDRRHGDEIRAAEKALFEEMLDEVAAIRGARELLQALRAGGERQVVLASSSPANQVDHYLDLLEARDLVDGWTTADDVDRTKPDPDLVEVALAKAGGGPAVMIGDSIWDCEAAGRAGLETLAVLTGGFCRDELEAAGAIAVADSLEELAERIGETPLGGA
jgi:HAD superfamily hydrolase (TIGR01509 family)